MEEMAIDTLGEIIKLVEKEEIMVLESQKNREKIMNNLVNLTIALQHQKLQIRERGRHDTDN